MEGVGTFYLTQGVLGVSLLVTGAVIWYQQKKIDKKDERIAELQDLRLADSKEVTKDVTAVLQANSQSNYVLAEKIQSAKGAN